MTTAVLRSVDGDRIELEVDRWRAEPDELELSLLDTLDGPFLDIGCGPGRIPAALAARGHLALGIDAAPSAAREARRRGAPVLRRSVFDPLPGEGRWGVTLLLDGNIGIGGDPITLLKRCHELLRPGGAVVVDVGAPGSASAPVTVRVEVGDHRGPWFEWALVAADTWVELATAAGLHPHGTQSTGDRWLASAHRS